MEIQTSTLLLEFNLEIDVHYQFIICLDYVLRTSIDIIKENGLNIKKKKQQKNRT